MDACLDFGGSSLKLAVADRGRLGRVAEVPVTGGPADLDRAAHELRRLAAGVAVNAAAIAVPGLVDAAGRRLVEAHGKYEWMLGVDLGEWARGALGAPAVIENDARAALVGEVASGCAVGERDAVILVLGTGIGTAAMLDGAVVRGPHGSAGSLGGHTTVDLDGPVCNCGNIGCAEVFGGSWALPDRIRDLRDRGVEGDLHGGGGFEAVLTDAAAGGALGRAVLGDAIRAWGACAVTMCHLFDPSAVILAGGVAGAASRVAGDLEQYLDQHLWASLPRPRLLIATEPRRSVLRGLAALAAEMMP